MCIISNSHNRYVTYFAESQQQINWIATIASVDNFDMLQTHSAVYQGRQHRSYHGTTIQLVQPLVSIQQEEIETHLSSPIEFEQQPNAVTVYTDTHTRHRHIGSSPESSPHKLGKVGPKKRRTIAMITDDYSPYSASLYSHDPYRSIPLNHFSQSEQEKRCHKNEYGINLFF